MREVSKMKKLLEIMTKDSKRLHYSLQPATLLTYTTKKSILSIVMGVISIILGLGFIFYEEYSSNLFTIIIVLGIICLLFGIYVLILRTKAKAPTYLCSSLLVTDN
jgi:uncharacterized membrane protein HdeD (DUF308 family)